MIVSMPIVQHSCCFLSNRVLVIFSQSAYQIGGGVYTVVISRFIVIYWSVDSFPFQLSSEKEV